MPLPTSRGEWTTDITSTEELDNFTVYTLVDITNTEITDPDLFDTLEYNQYQNLNTILQVVGMRTQPIVISVIAKKSANLKNFKFGSQYSGKHSVWIIKFSSEYKDAWLKENDPSFFLKKDIDGIAYISSLEETVKFDVDIFNTSSVKYKNIYFENNNI
jgi:hypothetical protein